MSFPPFFADLNCDGNTYWHFSSIDPASKVCVKNKKCTFHHANNPRQRKLSLHKCRIIFPSRTHTYMHSETAAIRFQYPCGGGSVDGGESRSNRNICNNIHKESFYGTDILICLHRFRSRSSPLALLILNSFAAFLHNVLPV